MFLDLGPLEQVDELRHIGRMQRGHRLLEILVAPGLCQDDQVLKVFSLWDAGFACFGIHGHALVGGDLDTSAGSNGASRHGEVSPEQIRKPCPGLLQPQLHLVFELALIWLRERAHTGDANAG